MCSSAGPEHSPCTKASCHTAFSGAFGKGSLAKMSGRGVPCLRCRGLCTGFEPHSWRKMCKSCRCSQEEHGLSSELDDDRKLGQLLAGSRYSSLTARLRGGDGARLYKRNRMIVTNPNISGKDPTFDTITYEWAPPGLTQKLISNSVSTLVCLTEQKCTEHNVFWKTVSVSKAGFPTSVKAICAPDHCPSTPQLSRQGTNLPRNLDMSPTFAQDVPRADV
ncbi:hypothetical protein IHE44_0003646 [Lamprotornis superbus]|uniref:PET domain-containing protein n=1 Tax=Lamprotornis superbus TaxID=245042 RepID=A0A835NIR3_9PASS|nr:hypothetical protein IHE44_0003646 [Lamprotornis superbus]